MAANATAAERFPPVPAAVAFAVLTAILAVSPSLPASVQAAMLAVAVIVSLPHGAIDLVIAERWLRPRLGSRWLPSFLLGYAVAAAATLLLWQIWAEAALGLFLAMSVFHFGAAEPGGHQATSVRLAHVLAFGGAPIIVPALAYPAQIDGLFAMLVGAGGQPLANGLRAQGALVWGGATVIAILGAGSAGAGLWRAATLAGVSAAFVMLPPLVAFALYFALLHNFQAIAHQSQALAMSWTDMVRASAWPSSVALGSLMLGWWMLHNQLGQSDAAIQTAFIGLAALTVPHMILAVLSAPTNSWNRIQRGARRPRRAFRPGKSLGKIRK